MNVFCFILYFVRSLNNHLTNAQDCTNIAYMFTKYADNKMLYRLTLILHKVTLSVLLNLFYFHFSVTL